MTDINKKDLASICTSAGYTPGNGEPFNVPIVQSTTYKYDTTEEMGDLFDLKTTGYFYSRLANPTNDAVAAKIAELEGGSSAILTSSGQAATFFAIIALARKGDHVIASSAIYGGSYNLIAHTLSDFGVESTFVDPDISAEDLAKEFKDNTKLVFAETISNPTCKILDIEKFAKAAHDHNVPLIVDNTFATPINLRPFEWGADIVTHSTSKYMDGSANAVGGCIVDSGNFPWADYPEKFPKLTSPDETYHGIVFSETFGKDAYITYITTILMRDLGAIPSPQNAYYTYLGLESLHLRVQRHCENALKVAKYLNDHEKIDWVSYPSLEGDSQYQIGQKYLPNGTCGVISFGPKGGKEAAAKLLNSFNHIRIATHVADIRTIALNPATTTHRQMNDEELASAGITPELIRLSVGIDSADDVIADLEQALKEI
ncbi:MAG: O-acetylhomoserine aminocarboxypropyltransferase/cysteine synthase family protein [Finegoldia sp.]|nr:O-acetylhomoserine aminocarboxypropyltransferase/cysteine synthase family protein [Finegoldia sp.]